MINFRRDDSAWELLRSAQELFLEDSEGTKAEAMRLLRQAEATSDLDCVAEVAACFEFESSDPKDHAHARELYELLRGRGYFKGPYLLARTYYMEISVPKDFAKAELYFREAAELGHATSLIMSNSLRRHGYAGRMKQFLSFLLFPYSYAKIWWMFLLPNKQKRFWKLEDFYPNVAAKLGNHRGQTRLIRSE